MKKGFLFSSDIVLALVLVVFVIGSLYAFYYYKTNEVVDDKRHLGMEQTMNTTLNYLAMPTNACNLTGEGGKIIKKIAFCWNNTTQQPTIDFNNGFNVYAYCPEETPQDCLKLQGQTPKPNNVEFMMKEVTMWVNNGNVTKAKYLDCITPGGSICDVSDKKVRIYVWPK